MSPRRGRERGLARPLGARGERKQHAGGRDDRDARDRARQATLGRRLLIDRSDMVAVIGDLERDGLIARQRDEEDRRRNVVRLTPAGMRLLKRLDARVEQAQDALLAPLDAAERRELQRLLTRVVEHHAGPASS